MANKNEKTKRYEEARRNLMQRECRKLTPYTIVSVCLAAITLLCFFFDWAQVYNLDAGVEVHVSGFSFMLASLTGAFTSEAPIYGNLSVPFNYYAEGYCIAMGVLTLLAVLALAAIIVLLIIGAAKRKYRLWLANAVLSAVAVVLLTACFAVGLAMNGSDILPIYCSGNPACSIRSYAVISVIAAALLSVSAFMADFRYRAICKKFRQ